MAEKKVKIFTYAHKMPDAGFINDGLHIPIQVGKAMHPDVDVCELKDNIGDNISNENYLFCEDTGIYWVLKNMAQDLDIIGNEHYRRRFNISREEILNILNTYDVIVGPPVSTGNMSVYQQYAIAHGRAAIDFMREILFSMYPEYKEDWEKFIEHGNLIIAANLVIMKREDYVKMYEFVFSLLFKFRDLLGLTSRERVDNYTEMLSRHTYPSDNHKYMHKWQDYQCWICGFLAERLVTLYVLHNFKKICKAPVIKDEGAF